MRKEERDPRAIINKGCEAEPAACTSRRLEKLSEGEELAKERITDNTEREEECRAQRKEDETAADGKASRC